MRTEQWQKFDTWPKGVTLDPAPNKSWFLLWWAVNPLNQIVFLEEFPWDDFYRSQTRITADGYVERIKAIEAGDNRICWPLRNLVWRIMDPNAGETPDVVSGKSLQDVLADRGLWFDTKIDDDVNQRVHLTQNRLEDGSIIFLPHLQNTIQAMERWVWGRKRGETVLDRSQKPKEAYKDGCDCVGYTVIFDPRFHQPPSEPGPEMESMGL